MASRFKFPKHNDVEVSNPSIPLFERIELNESMEREQAVSTIANLEEKISLLERVNLDLELRLEQKARESMLLEGECLESQRSGQLRIQSLEMDIRMWKVECAAQDIRNKELKEMLSRTEMEMHSIFQRKSEHGKSRPSSGVHLQQHQRTVQRSPSNSALMDAISDKEPAESVLSPSQFRVVQSLRGFLGIE